MKKRSRGPTHATNKAPLVHVSPCLLVGLVLAWPTATWPQTIVTTLPVAGQPVAGQAVAVNTATNKIYVAVCGSLHNSVDGSVVVIDGATNSTSEITAGVCPWAIAINPVTNKIYVANIGATSGFGFFNGGSVTVIDGTANSAVTINDPKAHAPYAVAVNPTINKIYVANKNSNYVTVIDGDTNSFITVADPNAASPVALAVNPLTNKVYVANLGLGGRPGSVTVIDGVSNTTISITDPNAVGPNAVAVNTVTNRIYVTNGGAYPAANHGNVTVIDGVTNATTTVTDPNAIAPGGPDSRGFAVAVDSTRNKIYVTNEGSSNVTIIDGATNSTSTVTDPNALLPVAVTVDETANRIYVANGGCVFGSGCGPGTNPGNISIINGNSDSTTTLIDSKAITPIAVAVNSMTTRVYVANLGGNLTVLDGTGTATTHTLAVLLAGSGSGTVASTPSGIDCGISTCAANFAVGTPVGLNASAASGSSFAGWSGPCSGTGACDVIANEDQFVTATFSANPMVAVPNVVGQTQAAATSAITGAGLVAGTVTQQSSSTVASGDVMSESPAANTDVASGSAVNLVVSSGSATPSANGGGGYGGGGGGGIDVFTIGTLLGSLLLALRRPAISAPALAWQVLTVCFGTQKDREGGSPECRKGVESSRLHPVTPFGHRRNSLPGSRFPGSGRLSTGTPAMLG